MITFTLTDSEISTLSEIKIVDISRYLEITEQKITVCIPDLLAKVILDDISNELIQKGLGINSEVNQYGRFLESLIDRVNSDELYD